MSEFVFPQEKYAEHAFNGKVTSPGVTMGGMTKREYFAAMAMQALVSSLTIQREEMIDFISVTAVKYADALLSELEDFPKTKV